MVVAAMAAGVVLAGCGSSGQSGESSAPVESASASGAVASAEECRSGPPISPQSGRTLDKHDGVFGTLYNETGSTLWVSMDWNVGETWCRLDAGRGAAFGAAEFINLLVSVGNGSDSYPGVRIFVNDPEWFFLPKVKTSYEASDRRLCYQDQSELDTGGLEENEENWLNGKVQGSVEVKRFPDSKAIAREWIGTSKADDWARIDLHVKQIGVCS